MQIAKHALRAIIWLTVALPTMNLHGDTQPATRPGVRDKTDATAARIKRLIAQLGSNTYEKRKLAQVKLREEGQAAIDFLIEAQYSETPEISFAVQQILGELSIVWAREDDPQIAVEVMRDYDQQPTDERNQRGTWLAQLEDGKGIATLARLIRYERSDLVAKRAAVSLMRYFDPQSGESIEALRRAVEVTLAGCKRTPANWIELFYQSLKAPDAEKLERLNQFATAELDLELNAQTTRVIQSGLLRLVMEQAAARDDAKVLRESLQKLVEANKQDRFELVAISNWLLDQQQTQLFHELVWDRFEDLRKEFPLLVYCGAESWLGIDPEKAERLAERAFGLTKSADKVSETQNFFVRRSTCFGLEERGHTEWAIREYKRLIETDSKDNWRIDYYRKQGVKLLADLLHDRGRDEEAADTLAGILDKNDDNPGELFQAATNETKGIQARMFFFRSEHYRQQSDRVKQIEALNRAADADPTDADVLIAMHRLKRTDSEWTDKTNKLIHSAIETFEKANRQLRRVGEIENRSAIATNLNQMAWLVSNTPAVHNSDVLHKAVQQSQRSLELRPHAAGYLDTLGRTWFAVGNLERAVRYQRRAVKLEPNTRQIRNQLVEFKQAASSAK